MKELRPIVALLILPAMVWSQEVPNRIRELAESSRDSVVVVTTEDRDGDESAMGTGFIIDESGLIATSLHVIGEARPIWVQLRGGQRHPVTEVFASDRKMDLAILRVAVDGKLTALSLADQGLEIGQPAVAIGHPLGLKNSVVSGVVAGEHDVNGTNMWQVAMTIEPGNSGGPLLDLQGRVHGVIVLKSLAKAFGFAVKVDQLKKLIEQPNPVSMQQWQTIGQIDSSRWTSRMGGRWRQRSGRILVEGAGRGFGGRALLLHKQKLAELPFELAVSVKLEDESGAAGLAFHSNQSDRHYGFYPSNGKMRLTSFEGPTVFSWHVLQELNTPHYRPGEWNELKVRVEATRITCFVNGHEIHSVDEVRHKPGQIGLCKFRDTVAEFKHFRAGPTVESLEPTPRQSAQIQAELNALGPRSNLLDIDLSGQLADAPQRLAVLERQASALEQQAARLRELKRDIHLATVIDGLRSVTTVEEDSEIDLLRGALWIAKLDNAELDIESYVDAVERMASAVKEDLDQDADEAARLRALDEYLFRQNGFHGSRTDYYNEANSHLDRVIDDREGLPITLSVLYLSLAKRLGLNVVGVGLPGHFVVRHEPAHGAPQLIDVFERGKRLSRAEANLMVLGLTGRPPEDAAFESATHLNILVRMVNNLYGLAQARTEATAMLRYVEALAELSPDDVGLRGTRAVLRHQAGRYRAAIDDLDWVLERQPAGINLDQVRRLREAFSRSTQTSDE